MKFVARMAFGVAECVQPIVASNGIDNHAAVKAVAANAFRLLGLVDYAGKKVDNLIGKETDN